MDQPLAAMGTNCAAHHHRELVPIEVHHVFPLGFNGPDVPANKVPLCANAHGSVHDLLAKLLKYNGTVPWTVRRRYGRRVRDLARKGYDQIVANRD